MSDYRLMSGVSATIFCVAGVATLVTGTGAAFTGVVATRRVVVELVVGSATTCVAAARAAGAVVTATALATGAGVATLPLPGRDTGTVPEDCGVATVGRRVTIGVVSGRGPVGVATVGRRVTIGVVPGLGLGFPVAGGVAAGGAGVGVGVGSGVGVGGGVGSGALQRAA
jgi:hypothetical protein